MTWMNRICAVVFSVSAIALATTGCSFGDDADKLKERFYARQTDSQSDNPVDSDTPTDTSTQFDSAISSDSNSDSNIDTQTLQDDSATTDSVSDSNTDSVDTDFETDSVTNSDSSVDTATVLDTNTNSDSEVSSDSDSDSLLDTEIPPDTDTGENCVELGWFCGDGENLLGFYLNCDDVLGCANSGEWCDPSHQCQACDNDAHCGAECETCGGLSPRCKNGMGCVECLSDQDCGTSAPACDTDNNICVECVTNQQCRPEVVVVTIYDTEPDTETATDTESVTNTDSASDADTSTATNTEPDTAVDTDTVVDTDTGVLDTNMADTETAYLVDTDKPWLSPMGVCTPDNTCSCWTETPLITDSDDTAVLRRDCQTDADCPSEEFMCLRDYYFDDGINDPIYHKTCLRICSAMWGGQVINGLECRQYGPNFVWVPVTTCYAFSQLGANCAVDNYKCSVDGLDLDSNGDINDAVCINGSCTYGCDTDEWCPNESSCGTEVPFFGTCIPQ
ncbi:MAG: hypothetical protein JXX14_03290 [Deltaproteobacteria bacterium]|nr:hypothetical protein [Deltaproteobacteria bacterium]